MNIDSTGGSKHQCYYKVRSAISGTLSCRLHPINADPMICTNEYHFPTSVRLAAQLAANESGENEALRGQAWQCAPLPARSVRVRSRRRRYLTRLPVLLPSVEYALAALRTSAPTSHLLMFLQSPLLSLFSKSPQQAKTPPHHTFFGRLAYIPVTSPPLQTPHCAASIFGPWDRWTLSLVLLFS